MCGRFALAAADSDELAAHFNADYFQPAQDEQADHPGEARRDNDQGGAGARQQESTEEAQQPLAGPSGSAGAVGGAGGEKGDEVGRRPGDGPVTWGSMESKAGYRVRYNVCPKSRSVVLRKSDTAGQYELDLLLWGLVPSWFKNPPDAGLSTINAQCESVFEGKPSWKGPRQNRRCVVLAEGFYEWLNKGKDKVPHFVKRKDGKLMAFAGLWDHCDYKGNFDPVTTFTILTTPVNSQLQFLHSRMPAILNDADEIALWLQNDGWNDKVKALVRPFQGKVEVYPVDKGVGKVGNESPSFIVPVAAKKGSLDTMFAKQRATATSSPSKPAASSIKASASPPTSSSAKPKLKSASPPSPSSSKRSLAPKKEEDADEGEDEAMNPDEDSPSKVKKLAKAEEEVEAGATGGKGKKRKSAAGDAGGGGKKAKVKKEKVVEVIDLADSDGDEGAEDVKPSPKKKAKKHFDAEGNEKLVDCLSVKE
ncbi:hypothetical protein JCM8097_000373 [Rhodosporidiobolus ruineniae]